MTKNPHILVYIGSDNTTRGDTHGFKGIGAQLADVLDGEFHYLEEKTLRDLYPSLPGTERLKRYFNDRASPSIAFSTRHLHEVEDALGEEKRNCMLFESYNEDMAHFYAAGSGLVAHHLTPRLLKEEGKKFREAYPNLPGALIAFIMSDTRSAPYVAEKLVSKCAAYPAATIFLCTSWRTESEDYEDFRVMIEQERRHRGLDGRLKVEGYELNGRWCPKTAPYNPYTGLLQEASHVIVAGTSGSLLSEPLAAGKPVIFLNYSATGKKMEERGLAMSFGACACDTRFETGCIAPVNVTRDIAEKIAAEYRKRSIKT